MCARACARAFHILSNIYFIKREGDVDEKDIVKEKKRKRDLKNNYVFFLKKIVLVWHQTMQILSGNLILTHFKADKRDNSLKPYSRSNIY